MQTIWDLFIWSLIIGSVIFVLVTGLVIYVAWRYRRRHGQGEPRQVAGNTRLEIGWTIAPALLLAGLFIPTVIVMRTTNPPPSGELQQQPDVVVTGYQWWWRVAYPQAGVVSANEVHIPVGKQVLVRLEAADVIHDFWVPDLAPKHDMIPGNPNNIWLQADKPGIYRGVCAEYCGVQHAKMEIYVVAQPQAEFDAWLAQQQQVIDPAPTAGLAAQGAQLYHDLTCVNCHAVGGPVGAVGAGPNLAGLGSRLTLGAGAIPNTPENLALWIANPEAVKPGVYMPGYARSLTDEQIRALVAYLETLK
jgi:cytochrome c oxidase subunit 2